MIQEKEFWNLIRDLNISSVTEKLDSRKNKKMLLEIGNTKAKLKFSFKCKKKGLKKGGQGNMSQQNKKIKTENK